MRLRGMRLRMCLRGRWKIEMPSLDDLHARYARQSRWFYGIRSNLLRRVSIHTKKRVLDLGCGTGVVTPELKRRAAGSVTGCDYDATALRFEARDAAPAEPGAAADASRLPFADKTFDLVFTQMFFMWVRDLDVVAREIHRVLQPGGHLLVAAEPDYGGRIEHPPALAIGPMLCEELRRIGADPEIARKLRGVLLRAGFEVEGGIHPSLFQHEELVREWPDEVAFLKELGVTAPTQAPDEDAFLFMPYFWFLARRTNT